MDMKKYMNVKNHQIGEFYTHMAAGKTPGAKDLREYGITTDRMKTRVRADRKVLHEIHRTGEHQTARNKGLDLAQKFLEDFKDQWEEPEMESPAELAARILDR